MVEFQKESLEQCYEEALPLLQNHYHEIAHYQDIEFDPDIDKYKAIEGLGILHIFTARKEGRLVGYAVFIVQYNMHYKQSLQALQDVLFVDPMYRGFGKRFIEYCDIELKKLGVQCTVHHTKAAHNFGPMLNRIGYELVDHIYVKRLDR